MPTQPAARTLRCTECGTAFEFSAGAQEVLRLSGLAWEPRRCPSCAHARPRIRREVVVAHPFPNTAVA